MDTNQLKHLLCRRRMLSKSTIGIAALADLLSRGTARSAGLFTDGEAPSNSQGESRGVLQSLPFPQRETGDMADHGRWAIAFGALRSQAQADRDEWRTNAREFHSRSAVAQLQGEKLFCLGPVFPFAKYGANGTEISSLLPNIGGVIDDICLVRSMTTDAINHDPAHMFMNTGSQIAGRPSMGAWVNYGLGSIAENLPGFVVLVSTGKGRSPQPIAARQWSSGFLPSRHQGVQLRGKGDAVLYLGNPPGVSREQQGADVDAINTLNRQQDAIMHDPEIATRIAQFELAFQMQSSVPELMDASDESQETLDLYGCQPGDGTFASNCILARRLAERGVRFIQLYHRDWDHHSLLREELPMRAKEVDQASAALIRDLKRRGMFDDTLIVWSGEFGRTPMSQQNKGPIGRDHHNKSMSMWLAGAGIRGGTVYGATDELGYAATEKVSTVHDLHATMLHQLGIAHDAFTYKFQGLDFKLTGVEGANVLREILA